MWVYTCNDLDMNPATLQCVGGEWIQHEESGLLPPLSSAEATQIAAAIGGAWMLGFLIGQIRKSVWR